QGAMAEREDVSTYLNFDGIAERAQVRSNNPLERSDIRIAALRQPTIHDFGIGMVGLVTYFFDKFTAKLALGRVEGDTILWSSRSGEARFDIAQIEFEHIRKHRLRRAGRAEKSLL